MAAALEQEIRRIKAEEAGEKKFRRRVAEDARQPKRTLESIVKFI